MGYTLENTFWTHYLSIFIGRTPGFDQLTHRARMRPPLPLQRSSAAAFVARARICSARYASSKRGSSRPRTYEYVVDHAGAVHLDTNKARTLATAYRDPTFLDELYAGLRHRRGGRWASQCLGEYSLLRADTGDPNADREIIVVFDKLDDNGLATPKPSARRSTPRTPLVRERPLVPRALHRVTLHSLGSWPHVALPVLSARTRR